MKKKLVILLAILDFLAILCLFVAYGPISLFRDWFIPTSMGTWTHSYFAQTIYSTEQIKEVLSSMGTYSPGDNTDSSLIDFDNSDPLIYDSIYEEQILKRDKEDIYKIIDIEGDTYTGHILVVYDPSRISLEISPFVKAGGQKISNLAKSFNALAAVNASGFVVNSNTGSLSPDGTFIMDGKLYKDSGGSLIGFNQDNVLVLTKESATKAINNGMKDAVSFNPFLIVNGEASTFVKGGGYGLRPRTAVGQRKDGIVLFVVINGNAYGTSGIDMEELTNIFIRYKAYNAANLDGGGSSSLWADGKLINSPAGWSYEGERYLPNAWIIK